jgi:alpha-galactosidase
MAESYRTKQEYAFRTLTDHEVYHKLPVIYNHWWAYEDRHINEELILRNAKIAHEIGVEMLVLDAGWFGNDSPTEEWYNVRGDWDHVNHIRFPHGLTWLKEQIEGMGLRFGIWCELEGLGLQSDLLRSHPEYCAMRDGQNLGYVCFGSPQVQEWAYQTMVNLFRQCGSTYWKLDFNLDPGLGCNAPGHCHGSGDGLQKHYEGLYQVLDRLQKDFPDLTIENCSSGGQRLNLEMGRHTHIHFLSDPDYSTHQMHQFKEASKWFLPRQLLHFMWSSTVTTNGSSPFPGLDLNALTPGEIRYHMRLAMMHQFGISHRLTEYTKHTLALMKGNLKQYREIIRPFVANGVYLPLYLSEHRNVFSFTKNGDSLLLLFAEKPGTISFDLSPLLPADKAACIYELTDLDTNTTTTFRLPKDSLMPFTSQENWSSRLLLLQARPHTG